ncbi:hypothetical protein BH18THE2_BH18THE2_29390 [soil metagenome]
MPTRTNRGNTNRGNTNTQAAGPTQLQSQVPALRIVSPAPNAPDFAITDQPAMPVINAEAIITGVNPDPTPNTVFEWTIQIRFQAQQCLHGRNRAINLDLVQTVQGRRFTPTFNLIRGGTLGLIATANVSGRQLQARIDGLRIVGTNPRRADVHAALGNNTLRRMACQESGQRQFRGPADGGKGRCPLFSSDNLGGAGILQLTNPRPTDDQVWNWRSNVAAGIALFNQKQAVARAYPARVKASRGFINAVNRFNDRRRAQGLPIMALDLPDFTPDQLELDTIRGFNGFAGIDQFGLALHEFRVAMNGNELRVVNITQTTGLLVWERVPAADRPRSGDPNYVNNILGHSPVC